MPSDSTPSSNQRLRSLVQCSSNWALSRGANSLIDGAVTGRYVRVMDANLERRILHALMGRALVPNAFRGMLVEAMLAQVLEPEWRWCAADWASHDFENGNGVRLEVKQSSALQSWHEEGLPPNRGRFDISCRKMRWEGAKRINEAGRFASIYVFGWHPECDPSVADHRDPRQWQFHVVATSNLPDRRSIGLGPLVKLAPPVGIEAVKSEIEKKLAIAPL